MRETRSCRAELRKSISSLSTEDALICQSLIRLSSMPIGSFGWHLPIREYKQKYIWNLKKKQRTIDMYMEPRNSDFVKALLWIFFGRRSICSCSIWPYKEDLIDELRKIHAFVRANFMCISIPRQEMAYFGRIVTCRCKGYGFHAVYFGVRFGLYFDIILYWQNSY